ncbi:hypothetical protein D3C71_1337200 [compost metagenome]
MPFGEVAQFVRQHGFDLVAVQPRQQRVEEHDAARPAESGEVRVAVARAARSVHHEQTVERKAAALGQALDALGQRRVGKRGELVVEGGDEPGVDDLHGHAERRPKRPGPDPPVRACAAHEPQHGGDQGQAKQQREERVLRAVADEQFGRHAVEAEPGFQPELAPYREGQSQQAQQHAHDRQQQQLPQEVIAGKLAYRLVDELQSAQQRQANQHYRVEGMFKHAQLDPRHRVIRRALVAGQPDAVGKFGGHLVAIAHDVADLACRQPHAHGNIGQQESNEQQCEHGRSGRLK